MKLPTLFQLTIIAMSWVVAKPGALLADVIRVAPGHSVQNALDRARAGDTVLLAPGVHRERVAFKRSGTPGKPVTLEGEPGAILDGSTPVVLDWQPAADVGPGVYRTRGIKFEVYTLIADGKAVTMLRESRTTPGTADGGPAYEWPTLLRGGAGTTGWRGIGALGVMLRSKGELLVRFEGDLDPRAMTIAVAPRKPAVTVSGVDRCVVRRLAIRNAAYGMFVENSVGSYVEHCTIGPADYGVWLDRGADRCVVRFNDIFWDPYPGADPRKPGAQAFWTVNKLAGHNDRFGVQINATRGGHVVHDNAIHDHWDGIEAGSDVGADGSQNAGSRPP